MSAHASSITGAASGMGAAIARRFAAEGAAVALLDRAVEALEGVAAPIGGHAVPVDVSDPVLVEAIAIGEALGGLDGVVNAAGILHAGAFETMTVAEQQRVLAVNLAAYVCHSALPHLREALSATIVNIASMAALRPPPGMAIYAASKAGLVAFGQALSGELGPTIRLNTICPGVVRTPTIAAQFDAELSDAAMAQVTQLQRAGTAEEIAEVALFLTTSDSAFMAASVVPVNGGQRPDRNWSRRLDGCPHIVNSSNRSKPAGEAMKAGFSSARPYRPEAWLPASPPRADDYRLDHIVPEAGRLAGRGGRRGRNLSRRGRNRQRRDRHRVRTDQDVVDVVCGENGILEARRPEPDLVRCDPAPFTRLPPPLQRRGFASSTRR
ncbi:SDR family NAD(P)-dependent oxidoreductase [Sphingomonas sp. MMS24-JH45]